jgi:DNA-binding response OmpR family regulator
MAKRLILIAEDEGAYAKILKVTLEKEGFAVVVAINGEELLKIARARKSELVILDLIMPVKNGFEVLSEMKKDEKLKHIKIIALSNLGQWEDIEKAKKLGADDYIVKSDEAFYTVISKIKMLLH